MAFHRRFCKNKLTNYYVLLYLMPLLCQAEIKSESNSTESEEDKKGSTVVEDSKTEKTSGSDKSELDQSTEPEVCILF